MAFGRAGDKAAAMEIKNHPARMGAGRPFPFAGERAQLAGFETHVGRSGAEAGEELREMGPQLFDVADPAFAGRCPQGH